MPGRDNAGVHRFVARAAAGVVVGPFLALASAFAPAHAHESDPEHSHPVIHSHFQPHEQVQHPDGPEVEPGSDHVVWLDSAIVHAYPYQLDPPPAVVAAGAELVGTTGAWSVTEFNESAPVHGPPRCASFLRGPPSFPA